ncbi:MAG: ATP synthase F0 subunit B [Myxococcales bacterium]
MKARTLLRLATLLGVLAVPTLALASGDGGAHHGGGVHFSELIANPELWASVVNFVLLIWVLRKLGGKSFAEFLNSRRARMEEAMKEASAMKEKAEARYREYTERMATLDTELKKLKSDIERAAEEDKQKIMAQAEEEARRVKADTETLIEQYAQKLSSDVRHEVVEAAVAAAEDVLKRAVNAGDQQRLAEQFKDRVSQRGGQA